MRGPTRTSIDIIYLPFFTEGVPFLIHIALMRKVNFAFFLVYNLFLGNWLCCENFSIADINLAILLQRLWELGYEGRYWEGGKRPLLENYYNRVKQRESFKKTIPNLPVHVKMILMSQPPAYLGAAGAASIGVVVAIIYIFKKIIH